MKAVNDIFKVVFRNLSKQGICALPQTLKKHTHQGWMSSVYTVESNKGKLIIHLIKPVKEHQKNRIWNKFYGLSRILSSQPGIPTPKILYSGLVGKTFVLAQFFVSGNRAGRRILKRTIISDKWEASKKDIMPNIFHALAGIHKIHLEGFGWPILRNKQLKGKHKNWKSFFEHNYPFWLKKIHEADRRLSLRPTKIKLLDEFTKQTVIKIDYAGPAVLVHGDSINPSNILVHGKNKITLLDWEWSILADPAWEFCDLGWWKISDEKKLAPYFKARNIKKQSDKADFINRINLYIPLWLLWGTYMHADDLKPDIYIALRKLLLSRVEILPPSIGY
ncbi:MAG: hypothetical protein A3J76_01255 [Candidatus Moranbacteria bacterium RBG_13_45_13]|nr:MAG: hypothetical protein A3J76_01255 [Candidatus Moranbacteria bacterium RBG_13_45_13]